MGISLLLLLAGWGIWKLFLEPIPPPPIVAFEAPSSVRLGDTLLATNQSVVPDSENLHWEFADAKSGQIEQQFIQFHLKAPIQQPIGAAEKELRLVYKGEMSADTSMVVTQPLTITCPSPPAIPEVLIHGEALPGKVIVLEVNNPEKGTAYSWDFGDDSALAQGAKTFHRYASSNQYQVKLEARNAGAELPCVTNKLINLNVAAQALALPAFQLKKDGVKPVVTFGASAWIALALLALGMVVFFVRKHRPIEQEVSHDESLPDAKPYAAPDRPPYLIPFRSNEHFIRIPRELYRLADVLRIRQEGLRRELDIDISLKKTINEGGFPNLVTKLSTLPTDYLVLIDKSGRDNHLTRLYEFITAFLQGMEVHTEVFFFDKKPIQFWNERHPKGISRIQLWRMHQQHRLIVMGDFHELLDPRSFAQNSRQSILRKDAVEFFSQWKYRILLTPQPVISWTWKEGALHDLFPIFPCDSEGLAELAKFMERDFLNDDQPVYANRCERLLENRQESDTNYINWRNARDCKRYFAGYDGLFQWFCALALYPRPEWPLTLATGKAIGEEYAYWESNGLLTLDNLLILCRVPWLQSGEMPERLRKELLLFLYPEVEAIARRAITTELDAVTSLVEGSHVNREWQLNHTLQHFALDPQNPEVLQKVQELKALGLLGRRETLQLNHSIQRHFDPQGEERIMAMKKSMMKQSVSYEQDSPPPPPDIDTYLAEMLPQRQTEPPTAERKPGLARNLIITILVFAILFLLMWNLSGSEQMAQWAGFAEGKMEDCQSAEKWLGFVQIRCSADSSILLNNRAVEVWQRWAGDRNVLSPLTYGKSAIAPPPQSRADLEKALELQPDYQLAAENLGAYSYNIGTWNLHGWLGTPAEQMLSQAALNSFLASENGLSEALKISAKHAEGLVYYYQSLPGSGFDDKRRRLATDSAAVLLKQIEGLSNGQFFDTTSIYPNLKSLLNTVKLESLNQQTATPQQQSSRINRANANTRMDPGGTDVRQSVPNTSNLNDISGLPLPEMVYVQGGLFSMGCEIGRDGNCDAAETPPHKVQISSFSIGKYEVTNRQFAAFLEDYGSASVKSGPNRGQVMVMEHKAGIEFRYIKGEYIYRPYSGFEDYPAGGITWFGATEYCKWLSEKTGQNYRLPTEAEWEYAARGGTKSKSYPYAGSRKIDGVANYVLNSKEQAKRVGSLQPNELGLYDCSGNLWEWCQDWFDEKYYSSSAGSDPQGPNYGKGRVYRGGSFLNAAEFCRLAARSFNDPGFEQLYIGFRVLSDGGRMTSEE